MLLLPSLPTYCCDMLTCTAWENPLSFVCWKSRTCRIIYIKWIAPCSVFGSMGYFPTNSGIKAVVNVNKGRCLLLCYLLLLQPNTTPDEKMQRMKHRILHRPEYVTFLSLIHWYWQNPDLFPYHTAFSQSFCTTVNYFLFYYLTIYSSNIIW